MHNISGKGLGKILRGQYYLYYPLKFETDLSYDLICENIASKIGKQIDFCKTELGSSFQKDVEQFLAEKRQEKIESFDDKSTCRFEDLTIGLGVGEGLNLLLQPGCMREHDDRGLDFEKESEMSRDIYGDRFIAMHRRVLLSPMHLRFYDGTDAWLHAVLLVFENKMGVLKLELPLRSMNTTWFKDCSFDSYVTSVVGGCVLENENTDVAFSELHKLYVQWMTSESISQIFVGAPLSNVVIVDCEKMPDHTSNIPDDVKKDLFEIVSAPVADREYGISREKVNDYLDNHSWGDRILKFITNTRGGCLTLIDKEIVENRKRLYAQSMDVQTLDEEQVEEVNRAMILSGCINAEFVLVVMALKRMNMEYIFREKKLSERSITEVQAEYNRNIVFLSELQNVRMGTVREQLQVFEQMMPYYVNEDLLETRMQAIDRIQASEEIQAREKNQSTLAMAGIILTAIFGLPAINETITILRELCTFIQKDIPCVTCEGLSVLCWGGVLFMLWKRFREME